jgi:catechol 2,3-dioxygenase-like lactoylglutathione lyase family enzyme
VLRAVVDATEQFWISTRIRVLLTVIGMYKAITQSQIFVLDQDEALDFYVNKLGLELHTDQDLGFMRWLTVNVPGDRGRQILLEKPGPPAMNEAMAAQVRDMVTKGAMGGWLCISTDDAHKTYETLKARGVELTDEPTERPYGVDFGIRDPFGNAIRIGQMNTPA